MTEYARSSSDLDPAKDGDARETVLGLVEQVKKCLISFGVAEGDAMFWGYSPDTARPVDDDFDVGDGRRMMFFGSFDDMIPPDMTRGLEDREEAWMVNPLKYAIKGGTLGVFSRTRLEVLPHEYDQDGFGTLVVMLDDSELARARLIPPIVIKLDKDGRASASTGELPSLGT